MKIIISALVFLSTFSFAQISVSSSDILGVIGKTATFEGDTSGFIDISPGPAGTNQIWNFNALVLNSSESTVDYVIPQDTPFPNLYPTSNFVRVQREVLDSNYVGYGYYEVNPTNIKFIGFAIEEDTTVFQETDEDVTPLPLSYGASWTKVTYDTLDAEGFMIITKDSTYTEVDAWGTINLAAGSFDCLRIRDNSTEYSQFIIGGISFSRDTTTYISYDWITKNNFAVAFMQSQDGETNANFTNASEIEILKSPGPTAITDNHGLTNPKGFELFQNYPNPFNPQTVIKFQLVQPGNVQIDVYSLNGKWVANLLTGQKAAGHHSLYWNGKNSQGANVASGIYYYTLRLAGKVVQSRKMTLVR